MEQGERPLSEAAQEALKHLKAARVGQGVLRRVEQCKPERKKRQSAHFSGANKSRRGTYDDDSVMANPANIRLDGGAYVHGYCEYDVKSGQFVEVHPPVSHVLDERSGIAGKGSRKAHRRRVMPARELCAQCAPTPDKPRLCGCWATGHFKDDSGPVGNSYVTQGKGAKPGTDRPDYSSPLVKRGVAVGPEEGWKTSHKHPRFDR